MCRSSCQNPSRHIANAQTVYLSGQTCPSALGEQEDTSGTTAGQTRAILARIDRLLEVAGTDKTRLLTANIWLRDIAADFEAMNQEWTAWIDPANKPVRATVQSTLCAPQMLVEIQVTAALPEQ